MKAQPSGADTLLAFGHGRNGTGTTSSKHMAMAGSRSEGGRPASLPSCPLRGAKDQQIPQRTLMVLIATPKGKRPREPSELQMAREPTAELKI